MISVVHNLRFTEQFPRSQTHLAIDESMVPYYGRHSAKQFIRGEREPIRFGYKVYGASTRLWVIAFSYPYQGSGVINSQLGLGGSVVANLIESLPQSTEKYTIYFDNFFTSLRLINYLSGKNVKATGTVRVNRVEKCPLSSVNAMKKTCRGTYDY